MDIAIGVDSIKIDLDIPTAHLPVCPGACTPCPAGSTQPDLGATRCIVCSDTYMDVVIAICRWHANRYNHPNYRSIFVLPRRVHAMPRRQQTARRGRHTHYKHICSRC